MKCSYAIKKLHTVLYTSTSVHNTHVATMQSYVQIHMLHSYHTKLQIILYKSTNYKHTHMQHTYKLSISCAQSGSIIILCSYV